MEKAEDSQGCPCHGRYDVANKSEFILGLKRSDPTLLLLGSAARPGAAMEGGGSYRRELWKQGAGGISALPLLEKAAASVAIGAGR